MDSSVYEAEYKIQTTHWWFVGRRFFFSKIIQKLLLSSFAPILDIGSSTGTNLSMLSSLGFKNFSGIDISQHAIKFCKSRGFHNINFGNVCDIPYENNSFDLVLATDILEHVDDDEKALDEIYRVLRPEGSLILTVPAFHSLWGVHDELAHHKRRYRLVDLVNKLKKLKFECNQKFYFNYILFIPIFILRYLFKIFKLNIQSENNINTKLLNYIFTKVFCFDMLTAQKLRPFFGVSIFILAKKSSFRKGIK